MRHKPVETEIERIVKILLVLPPEKLASVHDYVRFLGRHYRDPEIIDEGDVWTDEDIRDVTLASMNHALESVWGEEDIG